MATETEDTHEEERRERLQRAAAAAAGAAAGALIAGPAGVITGAALGPLLEPIAEKIWAEISSDGRRRAAEVLAAASEAADRPVEEITELINSSDRTRLLAGIAMSAATRTAWEAKARTLGRSLASGLLADDDAQVDTEQLILAAIADIEAPHLSLLDLLTGYEPHVRRGGGWEAVPPIHPGRRSWTVKQVTGARPKLGPVVPSLLGTLQRHGLAEQNDHIAEAIKRYAEKLADQSARDAARRQGGSRATPAVPKLGPYEAQRLTPETSWSPTELGEQVVAHFRLAGADVPDVWTTPGQPAPGGEPTSGEALPPVRCRPGHALDRRRRQRHHRAPLPAKQQARRPDLDAGTQPGADPDQVLHWAAEAQRRATAAREHRRS